MKEIKWFTVMLCLLTVIFSCSKEEDVVPDPILEPPPIKSISTPPGSFTKKVLLEYHTAAWSGTCPDAETKCGQVISAYPGKVIAVAIHQSDAMQIPLFMTLDATFSSNPAYGMVNRLPSLNNVLLNRTQWLSNTTTAIAGTAKCGLAINSTLNGTNAAIEVQAAFRANLTGSHNLSVYLVENNVSGTGSGYDQVNFYNADGSSPYYNLGNPIVGYKHNYVARKVLTANMGDAIEVSKLVTDGLLKKTFTVNVAGMNTSELYVVAFINKTGSTSLTHEVLNVQKAKIGALKNWD
ncbi:MAG: Omp28-related outer membrane protein [Bacteroidetes bacterium]|nr:Omp28-related outer membrane protein [Bacteroidota bacterium]